ncbi:MAG TPA: hypothetical protein VIE65_07495 [Methylobacter sp.]|jgi:hypothetical protein
MDIQSGDSFEYDGTIVKYAGAEFAQPGLRGAIRDGWATLNEQSGVPTAFAAERPVAKSQSINKDLSRVQRHQSKMDASNMDEDVVLDVNDRKAKRDPRTGTGHVTQKDNRRKDPSTGRILDVKQSDIDMQDHTPIGRIKSPTSMKVDVIENPRAARDIENRSSSDGYGRFAGRGRGPEVVEREGVIIKTNVGAVSSDINISDDSSEGRMVGKVRQTDKIHSIEGITVRDTSGRSGSAKASNQSVKKQSPKVAASGPVKPQPKANGSSKLEVNTSPKLKKAIRICPEFPMDWNFFGKPDDKIVRIEELGATPQLLDAVHSTDSPAMQKLLEQRFPDHFS